MFITGLGTATPQRRYQQRECWEALQVAGQFPRLSSRSKAILKKVLLGDNGIAARRLALDPLSEAFDLTPDALHARFLRHAPALAAQAAAQAVEEAGPGVEKVHAVIVSTCSGFLCPGLTRYVCERPGFGADAAYLAVVRQP